MSLAPYPSPEERDAWARRLAGHPGFELDVLGRSVEGREIVAITAPCSATAPRGRVLLSANIHGPELIGSFAALRFLERLAQGTGVMGDLRDRAEVTVVPCINPDGYARTWERAGVGKLGELRANARGVDLNRNYPRPIEESAPIAFAGSDDPKSSFYRGTRPLSEPETYAMDKLFERRQFHASVNLHSFMGTVIPPKVVDDGDYDGYRRLARTFATAQVHTAYRRLASRQFDVFTGEQEDHQHHRYKTWAVCIEIFPWGASLRQHLRAPALFWRFNPRDPEHWATNDGDAIAEFFLTALELERPRGLGPELAPQAIGMIGP